MGKQQKQSKQQQPDDGTPRLLINGLSDLVGTMKTASAMGGRTGGSQLASYDTISFNNNYSLITLDHPTLTYHYSSNGLLQTAIDLPVQDALSKGIEIESSDLSSDQTSELLEFMERESQWETLQRAWSWSRLYGGAALILNTNQDPSSPLSHRSLYKSPLSYSEVNRWQLLASTPSIHDSTISSSYYINGVQVHSSRVLIIKGKSAPWHLRQKLRGWSLSEVEHIFRALNLHLKTENVLYETIEESKVNVYKFDGLNEKLQLSPTNTAHSVERKVQLTNELKSVTNAIIMDKMDDFETQTLSFSGISEVQKENRISIAAALRMPLDKIFGLSASGFNSGESDLESYNQMVESNIREKMKPVIRQLIEYNMYHLWGKTYKFKLKWPSLRALNTVEEQSVKDSKFNNALEAFKAGLITKDQWTEISQAENFFPVSSDQSSSNSPKISSSDSNKVSSSDSNKGNSSGNYSVRLLRRNSSDSNKVSSSDSPKMASKSSQPSKSSPPSISSPPSASSPPLGDLRTKKSNKTS